MRVLLPSSILLLVELTAISTSAPLATPAPTSQASNVFPTLIDLIFTSNDDLEVAASSITPSPRINPARKAGLPVDYAAGVDLGALLPGVEPPQAQASSSSSSTILSNWWSSSINLSSTISSNSSSSSASLNSTSHNSTRTSHTSTATSLTTLISATKG